MELQDFTKQEQEMIKKGLTFSKPSDKETADKIIALIPQDMIKRIPFFVRKHAITRTIKRISLEYPELYAVAEQEGQLPEKEAQELRQILTTIFQEKMNKHKIKQELRMAIDGVKIIDSDQAYDIYNEVVGRYRDGEHVTNIIKEILDTEKDDCQTDFFTEIYWTAFAYSLWKIGHLTDDIRDKTLEIIKKGPDPFWLEIDSKALKQRQKVLEKLAVQLQTENPRPLKVPKAKAKRKPYFEEGDILAVKFEDEYGLVFVSMIEQSPRKLEYHLACTRLLQTKKPSIDDFLTSQISCKMDNTKFALVTDCWFNHKDLGQLLENIEKIGQVKLRPFSLWMMAPAQNLEDIYEEITRDKGSSGLRFIETYKLVDDIFSV